MSPMTQDEKAAHDYVGELIVGDFKYSGKPMKQKSWLRQVLCFHRFNGVAETHVYYRDIVCIQCTKCGVFKSPHEPKWWKHYR